MKYLIQQTMQTFAKIILFLIIFSPSFGQKLQEGQIRWSDQNKLTVEDYKIKISDYNSDPVFSQFVLSSELIRPFDLIKRNLNQKINNIFLGNASWIDTTETENLARQIEFQQMQFDISEIYARKFRKQILINRMKLLKRIKQIQSEILIQLSEERLKFYRETERGINDEKLNEWKEKIRKELDELHEFRYENTKKIKISKYKTA